MKACSVTTNRGYDLSRMLSQGNSQEYQSRY
nr:MAG TPA: hypothetical protein [Caudoviricetes sp.]